ncbi:MAG TPA: hypothetical protein VHR27_08915 [Blastocatellia bacterium]|jgi:hypothetical protein|nr:hypothetical protein [Blastocatellia bacterium]
MLKHIYLHGHGAADTVSLELKRVPSGAKVVIYAPPGAAISDSFAKKVYNSTDQYKDAGKWAEDWNSCKKNIQIVPQNEAWGGGPKLPAPYPEVKDMVFDLFLSGSYSLSHSGIYGERMNGAENRIYDIGKNSYSLSWILSYLDGQKLLDKDTYVHWLACHSDHIDHNACCCAWKVTLS